MIVTLLNKKYAILQKYNQNFICFKQTQRKNKPYKDVALVLLKKQSALIVIIADA